MIIICFDCDYDSSITIISIIIIYDFSNNDVVDFVNDVYNFENNTEFYDNSNNKISNDVDDNDNNNDNNNNDNNNNSDNHYTVRR